MYAVGGGVIGLSGLTKGSVARLAATRNCSWVFLPSFANNCVASCFLFEESLKNNGNSQLLKIMHPL